MDSGSNSELECCASLRASHDSIKVETPRPKGSARTVVRSATTTPKMKISYFAELQSLSRLGR